MKVLRAFHKGSRGNEGGCSAVFPREWSSVRIAAACAVSREDVSASSKMHSPQSDITAIQIIL